MRKTKLVTIEAEGRDKGRTYLLTEMSASRAEKWAVRAFLALAKSGVDVPPGISELGIAGVVQIGIQGLAGLAYEDAEPLLDEAFACVQVVRDLKAHPEIVQPLLEEDIDEVGTRFKLRLEIWELHVGFSLGAAFPTLRPAAPTGESSPSMPTSPGP